jgi:Tol biopolymer transport system component
MMKKKLWILFLLLLSIVGCAKEQPEESIPIIVEKVEVEVFRFGVSPELSVHVYGLLPDSCTEIIKKEGTIEKWREGDTFYIQINPTREQRQDCLEEEQFFFRGIGQTLKDTKPGEYIVDVNGFQTPFTIPDYGGINSDEVVNMIVELVDQDIRSRFGVSSFSFTHVSPVDWADACLELPEEGEMCAEVITPGLRVIAGDGQTIWEYHTNQDGSLLRWVVEDTQDDDDFVVNIPPIYLIPEPYNEVFSPAWSPDGTQIVFVYEDLSLTNHRDLYLINCDGTGLVRLTDRAANDILPQWSPNGSQILFISQLTGGQAGVDFATEIFVMLADGSGLVQLTEGMGGVIGASWSPDGSQISFIHDQEGQGNLFVMNADGSNVIQLTENLGVVRDAKWSPDGSMLVFTAFTNSGNNSELYSVNRDGTGLARLTLSEELEGSPQWSPDGQHILFESNADIFVMDPDGSNTVQLTDDPSHDGGAVWSPDGSKIAFHSDRTGDHNIFVMNADGSQCQFLNHPQLEDLFPVWSPDGTQLIFNAGVSHGPRVGIMLISLEALIPWER